MTQTEVNERHEDDERQGRHHRRSDAPGVFVGLVLVLLGTLFYLTTQGFLSWTNWWQYFLVGLGIIFLIEASVRYRSDNGSGSLLGRIIPGTILITVGLMFILGLSTWWPAVLIIAGVIILLNGLLRR
jgi:hypothetical protein